MWKKKCIYLFLEEVNNVILIHNIKVVRYFILCERGFIVSSFSKPPFLSTLHHTQTLVESLLLRNRFHHFRPKITVDRPLFCTLYARFSIKPREKTHLLLSNFKTTVRNGRVLSSQPFRLPDISYRSCSSIHMETKFSRLLSSNHDSRASIVSNNFFFYHVYLLQCSSL